MQLFYVCACQCFHHKHTQWQAQNTQWPTQNGTQTQTATLTKTHLHNGIHNDAHNKKQIKTNKNK